MFGGENSASGVARKFFNQASALSRLGLDLELVLVIFGDVHYPSCDFLTIHRLKDVPRVIFWDGSSEPTKSAKYLIKR